jgi:hypothetical protein
MGGKILIVAKRITETAERIRITATNGDITLNSAKSIKYSAKKDIIFGEYEPQEPKLFKSLEFSLKIKLVGDKTFVPLGIPSFKGKEENQIIKFEVEILKNPIEEIKLEIFHNGKVIRTLDSKEKHAIGKHYFGWNGFDDNGIYDSTIFTTGKLQAKVTGTLDGKINVRKTDEFSFEYKEVNWVDTKIDKNAKRIDATLRVNLKNGEARGTKCTEEIIAPDPIIISECPWDKIPEKDLISGKTPLKSQTKSFEDLEKLALEGLNYHWGRNQNHFIAKNVDINGELYEVYVNAVNTDVNAMDDVSLIFNTNRKWMRSGNPGTVEDPISFVGNIVSREAICYNVGYIKYSNGWGYQYANDENLEFEFTSAHEIGHTILKAYGGTFYSYGHKGSVNTVSQSMKSSAANYPPKGEIDIMPYYPINPPSNIYNRYAASKKDVLSLVWLTKITKK